MADGSIARRYAKALLALGQEGDNVDALGADLDRFAAVLGAGELSAALGNPGFTVAERRGVIDAVLEKLQLHKNAANFLRLLIDKNRFSAFADICRAYQVMSDEAAGRAQATVTTASALSKDMAKTVAAALEATTGKQVTIEFKVDPTLIGGMVAQVGDISYDASMQTRLEEIQAVLIRNPRTVAEA
jgi:F-type H+-transporting ATPase subunit delta